MMLKPGVRLLGLRPELLVGAMVAQEVFRKYGVPLIWTTCIEGDHATEPPSEHYQGNAADFRMKHLPTTIPHKLVYQEIVIALGGSAGAQPPMAIAGDFEVRHEDVGGVNEHLHVAFRPRRPLVTKL